MKQAIRVLKNEHQLILQQLDNLELAKLRLEKGREVPGHFFRQAVGFARAFADKFHHYKEEFVVFGLLATKEKSRLDTQLGALRFQHDQCRNAISEMETILKVYDSTDEICVSSLLLHLSAYISVLRRHIFLEDHSFFPIIEDLLTDEEDNGLMVIFAEEESQMKGREFVNQCRKQVHDMRVAVES